MTPERMREIRVNAENDFPARFDRRDLLALCEETLAVIDRCEAWVFCGCDDHPCRCGGEALDAEIARLLALRMETCPAPGGKE